MRDERDPSEIPVDEMGEKRKFHPQADQKNKIQLRGGKPVLTCGGKKPEKRGGGFCKAYAGQGTQHLGYGRCKNCGGNNTGPKNPSRGNNKKAGLYSKSLSAEESEVYGVLQEEKRLDLEHEIYMYKAKLVKYLEKWQKRWEMFYAAKEREQWVTYRCPHCLEEYSQSSLIKEKPSRVICYDKECYKQSGRYPKLEEVERIDLFPGPYDCELYAEQETRVYYSDGEGRRSYYNAGDLNDRTVNQALQIIARLARNHSLLNLQSSESLLDQVNAELKAASKGKVQVSWSSEKPQHIVSDREGGSPENAEITETS